MVFVTLIHGLAPRLGILLMNLLSIFKIVILIFIVVSGWFVLSGKTRVVDPHVNFRNAFAGSSHNSNDVSTPIDRQRSGGIDKVTYTSMPPQPSKS